MELLKELEQRLNLPDKNERLEALEEIVSLYNSGRIERPKPCGLVNNHIHTFFSFSPYSPAAAVYYAYKNGLETAGIMDHDSVAGCEEFIEAGKKLGILTTCGFECRIKMNNTFLNNKRINNPDQLSVAYVALHGIPHQNFSACEEFLRPFREHRNNRNKQMVSKLNDIISNKHLELDFYKDVLPVSKSAEGGSVTERHILFALSNKLTDFFGKGDRLIAYLSEKLNLKLSEKVIGYLKDRENPFYAYDLLAALKSSLVERFYIVSDRECPELEEFIEFAKSVSGISAYAYLGDVVDSVTADKKSQKFEDEYLEELFLLLKESGFNAITYMPSRNSPEQLSRVIKLCREHNFFQISGEDINSPRQSFICSALENEEYRHLRESTYALIGHEIAAGKDISEGMFSEKITARMPGIDDRIGFFAKIAKQNIL